MPRSRSCLDRITRTASSGRMRSPARRRSGWWCCRRSRTGRIDAGQCEFHAAFGGSAAPTFTNPALIGSLRAEDGPDQPFPTPVAPTTRTWVPSSCNRQIVPSSANATGNHAVSGSGSASNGSTMWARGLAISRHSSSSWTRRRTLRMRQSKVPNVYPSRSETAA